MSICYGYYDSVKAKFNSLKEAYEYLKSNQEWNRFTLSNIVYWNVKYRDYLRTSGVENVIAYLISEVPELATELRALEQLRNDYARKGIANYDVQLVSVHDKIRLQSHTFSGIEDIESACECEATSDFETVVCGLNKAKAENIHIANIYESYLTYVSSEDDYESRRRNLFMFSSAPLESKEDIMNYISGKSTNLHEEELDESLLPAVYHNSSYDYMLVATKEGESPSVKETEDSHSAAEAPKPVQPEKEKSDWGLSVYMVVILLMPIYSGIVCSVDFSVKSVAALILSLAAAMLLFKINTLKFFLMNIMAIAALVMSTICLF